MFVEFFVIFLYYLFFFKIYSFNLEREREREHEWKEQRQQEAEPQADSVLSVEVLARFEIMTQAETKNPAPNDCTTQAPLPYYLFNVYGVCNYVLSFIPDSSDLCPFSFFPLSA